MAYTTIDNPELYFQCKTYTGTGSSHSITLDGSENMQPAFTWIKSRTSGEAHILTDAVRGATKTLSSNVNDAETTVAEDLKSFDSNGFTVGTNNRVNKASDNMVAWNWKMGTTSGITTGGASVTPAGYSFSATAGQSVITWTGTGSNLTVPHGLGTALGAMFVKCTSTTGDWVFFHKSMGGAYGMELPSTSAKQNTTAWFNSTAPDADKFTIGTNGNVNTSSRTYVAYCFADVQGYSKFGSYIGNGNADGTFVYTGFKPAFLFIKNTSSGSTNWHMYDNKRLGYNVDNNMSRANLDNADQTDDDLDILSNGFKLRRVTSALSTSGDTYVYMAFAESPFVTGASAIPTTAR